MTKGLGGHRFETASVSQKFSVGDLGYSWFPLSLGIHSSIFDIYELSTFDISQVRSVFFLYQWQFHCEEKEIQSWILRLTSELVYTVQTGGKKPALKPEKPYRSCRLAQNLAFRFLWGQSVSYSFGTHQFFKGEETKIGHCFPFNFFVKKKMSLRWSTQSLFCFVYSFLWGEYLVFLFSLTVWVRLCVCARTCLCACVCLCECDRGRERKHTSKWSVVQALTFPCHTATWWKDGAFVDTCQHLREMEAKGLS